MSDTHKQKVNVYISTDDASSPRVSQLQNLFQSELFQVFVVQLEVPEDDGLAIPASFDKESGIEYNKIQWVLNDAATTAPENAVLYITDKLVANVDAKLVEDIVSSLLVKSWDICYLNKWLDSCDEYNRNDAIHSNGTIFTTTSAPSGGEAILFKPYLRDVVRGVKNFDRDGEPMPLSLKNNLNESIKQAISHKKIVATTISPNLFQVDIATIANASDYIKLNECRDLNQSKEVKQVVNVPLTSTLESNLQSSLQSNLKSILDQNLYDILGYNSNLTWILVILIILGLGALYFIYKKDKKM
jgi:hypothetical protein